MFNKIAFVTVIALLAAILVSQRSQNVVRAQEHEVYKLVQADISIPDGTFGLQQRFKFYSTQDALNEHSADGWELVTALSADPNNQSTRLIFVKK